MPRSGRACWVHSSATREVIATSRSARERSPPVTSRALACIAAVLARCPASVTRSRWRESSTTSRRAASSRSTVRTCSGSAWRTAALSTAGMPAASARPSRWAACERQPGVPSGPPWWTTSTASPSRGSSACQAARRSRARSRRPASTARPTSESGPSSTSSRLGPVPRCRSRAPLHRPRATCLRFRRPGGCENRAHVARGRNRRGGTRSREQVGAGDRHAPLAAQVGLGDQAAQRGPADPGGGAATPAPGEHGDPGPPGVDDRATARRGA